VRACGKLILAEPAAGRARPADSPGLPQYQNQGASLDSICGNDEIGSISAVMNSGGTIYDAGRARFRDAVIAGF